MLEDRDYMRQPEFGERRWLPVFRWRWSWTVVLLVSYVTVFVAKLIAAHFFPGSAFFSGRIVLANGGVELSPGYLPLSVQGLAQGYVWQLLTYQFLHANWLHLFFNCWAIFIFGSELEYMLGARRFLALTFASGIVGGIFQVLAAIAWPAHFGGEVIGASACAFGLVAAFAMLFPERELTMLVFFVIPVRMRARTLLIFSAVVALVLIAFPIADIANVANAAHLGGMALGWFYVRKILKNPSLIGSAVETDFRPFKKTVSKPAAEAEEVSENDVDAILDKISARGIQSLTARERAVLEAARKRMAQR
jgi:membrane associated rhomboid family serine protease